MLGRRAGGQQAGSGRATGAASPRLQRVAEAHDGQLPQRRQAGDGAPRGPQRPLHSHPARRQAGSQPAGTQSQTYTHRHRHHHTHGAHSVWAAPEQADLQRRKGQYHVPASAVHGHRNLRGSWAGRRETSDVSETLSGVWNGTQLGRQLLGLALGPGPAAAAATAAAAVAADACLLEGQACQQGGVVQMVLRVQQQLRGASPLLAIHVCAGRDDAARQPHQALNLRLERRAGAGPR